MSRFRYYRVFVLLAALVLAGCASYRWSSSVPERMRTVSVPAFRNGSRVVELGNVMARQVLREFAREGTFRIRRQGDAALEIQGEVVSAGYGGGFGDRRTSFRLSAYPYHATVKVSVIDKINGKVLMDNRVYRAETEFVAGDDMLSAERDASGRLAEDLASRVVDDVLALKWKEADNGK